MIKYHRMTRDQFTKLSEIDRSESIDMIYEMHDGTLTEVPTNNECPSWDTKLLLELQERYREELDHGGMAVGAFDGEMLVGFGVLANAFRGEHQDQLQVDLMYVSRLYRRQGIGTQILDELSEEARCRGAKYLYISSTETRSAVSFYKHNGGELTDQVDAELFEKEPLDIHMLRRL